MKIIKYVFLALLFVVSISVKSQLYINEFLTSNTHINYDPDNTQFVDWIEIYNAGSTDVNIGGCFLTDDSLNTQKWVVPANTIINANGYYIFWADKLNFGNHTNFGLSRSGEFIGLYSNTGVNIDKIAYNPQEPDISYGRNINNISEWGFFFNPTPNTTNNTPIYSSTIRAEKPSFSINGGVYSSSQTVSLTTSSATAEIRYTTDGTNPIATSTLYSSPINIDTITNLRAVCFDAGIMPSEIVTNTYFVGITQNLPIISITTEPKNFYNDTIGIYCVGTNGIEGYGVVANYWHRDWERPANIEFFESDGTQKINQLSGIQINGERRNMGQKSLRVFARSKYGNPLYNYDFFNIGVDNYQSLVFRNGGVPDFSYSLIRDNLAQKIITDRTNIDVQGSRVSVVYVNGEYYGIYSIKEKQNEKYLAAHHKIDPNNIDMLENANKDVIEGSNEQYLYLMDFFRNHNLNDYYNFIDENIDIGQFLDYLIAEIYMGNSDWPTINIKFWKEKNEKGKWRWIIFDTDACFMELWGGHNYNSIEHAFRDDGPNWPNSPESTELNRLMISNNDIRYEFFQRMAAHANTTFLPQRILPIVETMKNEIEPEMPTHIERWKDYHSAIAGDCVQSMADWYSEFNDIENYTNNRWEAIKIQLIDWFNLFGTFNLTTTANNGTIKIYDIPLNNGTTTGDYFLNIPIKFKAVPNVGFKFVRWEGASNLTNPEIELTLTDDADLTAIFEPDGKTILPTNITGVDTLYYNQSPYIGMADLTIQPGGHLYVEPGVEVYMPENTSMYVYGKLIVAGTEQLPVLFDVNSDIGDENWGALCFYNSTDSSIINYLQIKNTTTGQNKTLQKAAISLYNSIVAMNNIDVSDCYQPIYAEGGNVYLYNSSLRCEYTCDNINVKYANNAVVENCDIKGNEAPDTDGIDFDNTTNGLIKNNTVYSFNGYNSDAIDIGEGATVLIENNIVFNCTDKGVSVGQGSNVIIKNNIIYNCNMGIGIKDSLSYAQVENNTIYNTDYGVACFEKNYSHGGGIADIVNTIISGSNISPIMLDDKSHITVSYSCSDTQPLTGVGNINSNPLFVDTIQFNFELQSMSPCINSGDPSFPTDDDGTIIDIGAYYSFSSEIDSSIVINEINYFSYPIYESGDWFELVNTSDKAVDLSGWFFVDGNKEHKYKLPDGLVLNSYSYIVFCNSWQNFTEQYPDVTNFRGNFDFNLSNTGEMLRLYDSKMNLVDFVEYSNQAPWPVEAAGQMPTLELLKPSLDNNIAQNWTADKNLGSPGEANNSDDIITIKSNNNIVLYPNPTNTFFIINLSKISDVVIYSIDGNEVATYKNYNGQAIDISMFNTGVYIVKIVLDNKIINKKLIVK